MGDGARTGGGGTAGGATGSWSSANLAYYYPFWLPCQYTVRRVFWGNGSTVTGNKDFGIYTADGTLLYSTGSTGESGASAIQYVTPTAFVLSPGRYYMAVSCSATTNHGWILPGSSLARTALAGGLVQASALPLPATATFATMSGNSGILLCGITQTASGF